MATFEELRKEYGGRRHSKGCPICGEPNAGGVIVGLRTFGKNKAAGGWVGSRMLSFCEPHAAEVFTELVEALQTRASRR